MAEACREGACWEILDLGVLAEGGDLFGRAVGQEISETIADRLSRVPQDSVLLLDLRLVHRAAPSVVREVVSMLTGLRSSGFAGKYLLFHVDMAKQEFVDTLEMVARDQGSVIPVMDMAGGWHALGRLTVGERDTLALVLECEEVTSTQLSERLHLAMSAASNRLRRLHGLRLIRREERLLARGGGREFIYRPLIAGKQRGEVGSGS
jgi:hypothetical protein